MSTFRTSLGQEFAIERRLPSIGWKPKFRGRDVGDMGGLDLGGGDDLGIFAIFGLIVAAIFLILVAIPLLIFVAELALLLALIIPLTILALAVGLKQHLVVLRDVPTGTVIDQRSVHGVIGSVRAARALKSAANAGAYQR
ncbi:MAG: hypothetical protein JHD16_06495 [Solirubrobacteraceae bacterium]|nr:hypothetical protein [Solirubrobacteraceae bacterium]